MFKKIIILVITVCYFLSVTGTTIDKFYCCGKLKKTSIFFRLEHKGNCSKKMAMKKGCCSYDESFYKVKDIHQSGVSTIAPTPFVLDISCCYDEIISIKHFISQVNIPFSNGPPIVYSKTPIFLMNCNFRI